MTSLPGIGKTYGQRLKQAGYYTVSIETSKVQINDGYMYMF